LRLYCRSTERGKDPRLSFGAERPKAAGGLPPDRKRFWDIVRDESGQSVVEFGMVVPLLCVLVLVLVSFGKAMNYWIDLTHIANQGARLAAVNADVTQAPYSGAGAPDLPTYIRQQAETTELRGSTVSICMPGGNMAGAPVTVQVAYPYELIPFSFIGFAKHIWSIKGSATMRLEHSATKFAAIGSCS
jgi:hypothetical protein